MTAVRTVDQRYYAASYGRFNTADQYRASASANDPGTWNRYAYVGGDPINYTDPSGRDRYSCSLDGISISCSSVIAPDCIGMGGIDGFLGDGGGICFDPGYSDMPVEAPAPVIKPKCWQDIGNIVSTLDNLGNDIENDVSKQFSAADMQLLNTYIALDVASETKSLTASGASGIAPDSPNYVGGHFNLNITAAQVSTFSDVDQALFASLFGGTGADGVRQPATTGTAEGSYTLHSHGGADEPYSFHFDRFNPYAGIGLLGHFGYDVIGGHLGHPCLDPAWH